MTTKKRMIECPSCKRIMRTCSEVEDSCETDHLYLMAASDGLPGLVKIGRSQRPVERACQLQEGMPFHMVIHCIFYGRGDQERLVRDTTLPSDWHAWDGVVRANAGSRAGGHQQNIIRCMSSPRIGRAQKITR